jgi:hypothetical protein
MRLRRKKPERPQWEPPKWVVHGPVRRREPQRVSIGLLVDINMPPGAVVHEKGAGLELLYHPDVDRVVVPASDADRVVPLGKLKEALEAFGR